MAVDGFTSGRRRSRSKKRQRLFLVVAALVILGFATLLVMRAFKDNLVFFFTPTDVVAGKVSPGQQFRLGGLVEMGSLQKAEGSLKITFNVTDGDQTLQVSFEGFLPDLFREGQGVVAEGKLVNEALFVADTVLAKHDETYMPPEVADALKEKGLWKHGGEQVDTVAPQTPTPDAGSKTDGSQNEDAG